MTRVLGSVGQEGYTKLGGCFLSEPATRVTAWPLDSRTMLSRLVHLQCGSSAHLRAGSSACVVLDATSIKSRC